MNKPIYKIVDDLPTNNITIMVLKSLDFVVPGEWNNLVGFDNTIREVTGETDEELIQQIGDRAVWLYNDKSQGYQRSMWLYQTVDAADKTLATAAFANKVGESIPLFGFLNRVTPNPDKAQAIDLSIKLAVELLAFCQINGIPGDSIGDFAASIANYSGESLMRITALICLDGLIPLGPDFLMKIDSILNNLAPEELEENTTFNRINEEIPGEDSESKLNLIGNNFAAVRDWIASFVEGKDLSPDKVMNNIRSFVEVSDDKLDYVAAFLDMTTNYYEHTGTQTLARSLIDRAFAEI